VAWTPIRSRVGGLDGLPEVLAGPILRRVESNSVSVWIAMRNPQAVRLNVFAPGSPASPLLQSAIVPPDQLGEHLFVTCLTATPVGGATLAPNTKYAYDIIWDGTKTLASAGFLSEAEYVLDINLPGETHPTFLTLPTQRSSLRFFHASCRKAHGPAADLLPEMDLRIRDTATRPHLLLLTGDQIYADDVADEMLFMILDAERTLMGLSTQTLTQDLLDDRPNSTLVAPGTRADTVRLIGFSGGLGGAESTQRSHLFTLGEYYMMYLFAWSDVLWPEVDQPHLPPANTAQSFYAWLAQRREAYRTQIPVPIPDAQPSLPDDFRESPGFTSHVTQLSSFAAGLHAVRRAMANVPVMMTADDHEITDDWLVNRKWAFDTYSQQMGRQVTQNGLIAFALCQAWGNDPAGYGTGTPGKVVRDRAVEIGKTSGSDLPGGRHRTHRIALYPTLPVPYDENTQASSFRVDLAANGSVPRGANALRFDWLLPGPGATPQYEFLSLDTRTERFFPTPVGAAPAWINVDFAQLMSDDGLLRQLGSTARQRKAAGDGVVIVVSGGPLLGHPLVEMIQKGAQAIDDPSSRATRDAEAWRLSAEGFDKFLKALIARRINGTVLPPKQKFLFLSGDVHYGFCARMRYWDQGSSPVDVVAVQATASSLKNEAFKTRAFHYVGYVDVQDLVRSADAFMLGDDEKPVDPADRVFSWLLNGWAQAVPEQTLVFARDGQPLVVVDPCDFTTLVRTWDFTASPPQRRYRTDYLATVGTSTQPPVIPFDAINPATALFDYQKLMIQKLGYFAQEGGRRVVGYNNLGEISFGQLPLPPGGTDAECVVHTLWWRKSLVEVTADALNNFSFNRDKLEVPERLSTWQVPFEPGEGTLNRFPTDNKSNLLDPAYD
jgi:hypothetical protein